MSTLLLTEDTGDLDITNNSFTLVEGRKEMRQRVINELRTFLGEWFLDTTKGVPYHQIIFVKGVSPNTIDDVLKNFILGITGVVTLTKYTPLDLTNRKLTVDFDVQTQYGAMTINEEIV